MTNTHVSHGIKAGTALCAALVLALVAFAGTALAHDGSSIPGVEVNINAGGNTLVRGAEVTAVSGSDISAKTSFGAAVMNWLIKTDSNTEFSANHHGATGLANIMVGDTISFRGLIDQSVAGLTVKAKHVKEWTKKEAKTRIEGTVTSINSTLNSFVVTNGNATTTVQANGSTKFETNGRASTFADLFVNAKVKILGFFNASSTVFTAASVNIASSTKKYDGNKEDAKKWRDWIRSKVWIHVR